ncbi:Ig-like domain-containing protein [Fulvivirgaceae bacterium PWU5]|uniref:Ig-like domain-containing protein n=1 Tax=Dawidia cretensis TaxID=2782350 RepID=A0AAP2E1G2_9BACT|nr:sugar-binding protein [Dawidia cretensis]MBT1711353.1 Ig-like domain-containing protein [Dawidia cretensis]
MNKLRQHIIRNTVAGYLMVLLVFLTLYATAQSDGIPRGAQLPYTRYESEDATRGGSATLQQTTNYDYTQIASEASNQKYVSLASNGSYVEWTTTAIAQGVNMRFTMPDNATGTGQNGALSLYVNGSFVRTINLTSRWAYQYFHGSETEPVQEPGGKTFMRFDEVHFRLPSKIQAGSTVRIVKENGDALTYGVDFLELEDVPTALAAPMNSLSVTAYGAIADDQTDDLPAFYACINAAKAQGKSVYIPQGRFMLADRLDLNVTNMKIQGAGVWYTEVFFSTDLQFTGGILARSSGVEISDFSLNTANNDRFHYGELNPKYSSAHGEPYKIYKGFMGTYGTGSRIHDVWIEHFECGFWVAGYDPPYPIDITTDLIISRARIRNNYADGVNFCQGTNNSVVEYSSVRNSGDDGLAMWPNNALGAPQERNNIFRYNTIENVWRAGGIAIFGGTGHQIYRCIIKDGVGGSAIRFTNDFGGHTFEQNGVPIVATDNYIVSCGTSYDLWNQKRGAIELFTQQGIYDVEFYNTQIINSQRHAIQLYGNIRNMKFFSTKIDGTGLDAFVDQPAQDAWGGYGILAQASGDVTFNNITFNRLESGEVKNHNTAFIINLIPGNVALTGIDLAPTTVSVPQGKTANLNVTYTPSNATQKGITWTSSNTAVATVVEAGTGIGTVTGVGVGTAVITARSVDGNFTKTSTVTVTPAVNITSADAAAGEGGNTGTFTIGTSGISSNITVAYTISGTASTGDYIANPSLTGTVTLTAASPSQTITITPTDDSSFEGPETLTLTLQPGTGYNLGGSTTAAITIADNENPPCTSPVVALVTGTAPTVNQTIEAAWSAAPIRNIANTILGGTPGDYSGRWRALYNSANLYFLVEVNDATRLNDSGSSWWEDDVVEIFIDGNNSKGTSYDGANDFQLGFRWNDTAVKAGGNSVTNTTGINFAMYASGAGYILEVAIPWSTIGVTPALGNTIGLDIQIDDDDNGGTRDSQIASFATNTTAWQNPSVFGTVFLTSCGGPVNQPPVANAGMDKSLAAGTTTTTLPGTGSDPEGGAITYSWTQVSGAATTLTNTTSATATVSGLTNGGTYVFQLTVSDGVLAGSDQVQVTVAAGNVSVTGVTVSPATASLSVGATQQLTATVAPANATNKTVTWSSANTAVATVNTTGLVTAVATGNAVITVTTQDGNRTATSTIAVTSTTTDPPGVITARRAPGTITVDGNLSESGWNVTRAVSKNVIGTGNNTVAFGVLWDNSNLYVGVRVQDAALFNDSSDPWENDAVEIYIDANNNKLTTYDGRDNQFIKGYNASSLLTKISVTGVQHAWAAISGGYSVEMSIPWSQLNVTPAAGVTLGFDIGNDDDDNGGTRETQAVWNGTIDNYQNTAAFGSLVLNNAVSTGPTGRQGAPEIQLEDADAEDLVSIYPNPAVNGMTTVSVPETSAPGYIQVFNLHGLILQDMKMKTHREVVDLSRASKGVYLMKVQVNSRIVMKKVLVE